MSREDFLIGQDDLLPVIYATFTDRNGPLDLSGASGVKFQMINRAGAGKVDAAATILDATGGEVYYSWTGTDTDTPGLFYASFQATINSKKLHTQPKLVRVREKFT